MVNNFLTVGGQVLILFLLIGVGYVCNKAKLLDRQSNKRISDLVVIIVAPCVIIRSFALQTFEVNKLKNLLFALLISVVTHLLMMVFARLFIRGNGEKRRRVLRFSAVFSNCGFVALPLQEALLGVEGAFYGAAFIAVFNIFLWSYGVYEMSGDKSTITPKKLLVSPGIIGIVVGIVIFVCSIPVPTVLMDTLTHISALNVPLPMIVVGYYLAEADLIAALKDYSAYCCMALRLIFFPLAALGILYLLGVRGGLLTAMVIAISAPVGATATMFSEKFDVDTELSVKLVSLSTLLSLITMPLIVGLTMTLA